MNKWWTWYLVSKNKTLKLEFESVNCKTKDRNKSVIFSNFLPSAVRRGDRPAPSGPENDGGGPSVAYDRRRGTSLVPLSPEMTAASTRPASGPRNSWMGSTLATRPPREHFALPVVALHHLSFLSNSYSFSPFLYHSLLPSQERNSRERRFRNAWKMDTPAEIKFHSRKKVFSSTVLLEETRFLRQLSLHVVRNLVNTLANHTCTSFSFVLSTLLVLLALLKLFLV